ncbi:MAG: manganese efflux pump MntP family protein [Ruminococcus sp.]
MSFWDLVFIAVGLAMDAFAVAIGKGLSAENNCKKVCVITGVYFGSFQALMPFLGYLCGETIRHYITSVSKIVSLVLLVFIGLNMIRETIKETDKKENSSLTVKVMLPVAIATSIDAFAVGVTFAALEVNIWSAILLIGITTFCLSCVGVKIGSLFGTRFEKKAGILGGIILILIGIKIFITGN